MTTQATGHPQLRVGSAFAGYRIDSIDDQSGQGAIYTATHLESERLLEFPPWPVALKVFTSGRAREPAYLRRFVETARLQSTLQHPNVVSIYEVGTAPAPFLSMTLARGPTLADLMGKGELDHATVLGLFKDIAAALEAGNERGLSYRRLRPRGVLITTGGPRRAFLGDFGAGRPDDVEAGSASQVRSLGAMLFECLAGEPADAGGKSLTVLRPDLPDKLEVVLARAVDDDPGRRQASPAEFIQAVERAYPGRRSKLFSASSGRRRSRREPAVAAAPATPAPAALPLSAADGRQRRPLRSRAGAKGLVWPAALTALLLVGAALLGALAGGDPEPDAVAGRAKTLSSEPFTLRHPANWVTATPEQVRVPGLALVEPVSVAPRSRSLGARVDRALVAGRLEGGGLPESLLARLPRQPKREPKREPVELGAVQAYRYDPVKPRGFDREVTLYVVPTSAGAVVMGCMAPAGSSAFLGSCERVASTLRLRGASAVALAPSPGYARQLTRVVSRLNASRADARRRLRRARTRSGQAGNAARLSIVYRRARRDAAKVTPPPGAKEQHAEIVAAFAETGRAYRSMAAAARARANRRWSSARAAALSGEQAVQRALRDLGALGYAPQSGARR